MKNPKSSATGEIRSALPKREEPAMHPELLKMVNPACSRPQMILVWLDDFIVIGFRVFGRAPNAEEAFAFLEEVLRGGDWPVVSTPVQVFCDNGEMRSDAVVKAFQPRNRRLDKARRKEN